MNYLFKLFLILLISVGSTSVYSKEFKSLKFEPHKKLKCKDLKDGTYCLSEKKDIILNLTVQKRNPNDNLTNFKKHLEKKIVRAYEYVSIVKETKKVFLNDWAWISSNHYESEYLLYNTQYYITLKGNNSYLISLSYKEAALSKTDLLEFSKKLRL